MLLAPDDPAPVLELNPAGTSPFFLTCDHYGRLVPRALGDLGVSASEWERHIAWDIGIGGVTTQLSTALSAHMIAQTYSRLVIDCNRPPDVQSSIPILSEATRIPGNEAISQQDQDARRIEIFEPYHDRISAILDARARQKQPTILLAMHSFTPLYAGVAGPGTSARFTIATGAWRKSCSTSCMRRATSSWATTSPMRQATRPTTASPCMPSRAASSTAASRSARI